ncbi:unnamed protein product, partial [marine sediment metagenome]
KIGRLVHAHAQLQIDSVSSPVGYARVLLPFTVKTQVEKEALSIGPVLSANVNYAAAGHQTVRAESNAEFCKIYTTPVDNSTWIIEEGDIFSVSDYFSFTLTFIT